MKKVVCVITTLVMLLSCMFIPNVETYAANISLGVSSSSIKIGDAVSVTVSIPENVTGPVYIEFSNDVLEFTGANVKDVGVNGRNINISMGAYGLAGTNKATLTFKAKTSGSATISASHGDLYDDNTYEEVKLGEASTTITVANQTADSGNNGGGTTEQQKSSDNTLSSLKLSSGTLSPSFKKATKNYTATVNYDVSKVVVTAKANHSKAVVESVTGNGTVNLKVGENTIKIVVRAENGVKSTYTIVVTRKAQETTTPPTSESESQSESEQPVVNEMLQWNGEQLQAVEEIPADKIPASFESTLLVVNGQQMPGLSFANGDLKVLYLNNTNNAGSLYVYDEVQQTIYPFIKLTSEKSYVMVLLPDEQNAPAPEGFESCTLSIEGKGLVSAYQLKETAPVGTEELEDSTMSWNLFAPTTVYAAEPKANDFYLIYCMNDAGDKNWYMYDSVEETFQRYLATTPSVQVDGNDSNLDSKVAALQKELNTAKMTQYIIVAIAAAVIFILVVVIIVMAVRNRNKDEDFFEGYEDEDDEEYDDEDDEEYEEEVEEVETTEEIAEVVETTEEEEVIEDDDEIEIEFYEMEASPAEETVEEVYVDTMVELEAEEDDDEIEIEFYEMEEAIVAEAVEAEKNAEEQKPVVEAEPVVETEPAVKVEPVVKKEEVEEIKIERRPRVTDPTSILSSVKEDDDDLEFIDFE